MKAFYLHKTNTAPIGFKPKYKTRIAIGGPFSTQEDGSITFSGGCASPGELNEKIQQLISDLKSLKYPR
jgi:hypothetical protein